MLLLGAKQRTVTWEAAGIELDLVPLDEETDARLVEETTKRVYDEHGRLVDVKRDVPAFARKVGRHCIKGWRGVCDDAGEPVECTPENIDEFMRIRKASDFVFDQVRGLQIHLWEEVDEAKKG